MTLGIAAADVIWHQRSLLELVFSELLLHARLWSQYPVHRLVQRQAEIVLGGCREVELFGQCVGVPEPRPNEKEMAGTVPYRTMPAMI